MNIKEKIKDGLLTIVLASLAGSFGYTACLRGEHEKAWRAAGHLADRKGDYNHIISNEEYNSIYRALNLEPPQNHSIEGRGYALELPTEQLIRYVTENQ